MNISFLGKKLVSTYHHFIMTVRLNDYISLNCKGYSFRIITKNDLDILRKGDFSVQNMIPYLYSQRKYSTGLLCLDNISKQPVGYIWVIRRGGNEMVYKVRHVEALISCVCVFKEFRGNNIANLMIGRIIDLLRSEGGTEVALGVRTNNVAAIKAYEKAGFIISDKKDYLRILRVNFPYHVL